MANRGHDEATKAKALTISLAAGISEASRQTGVPTGTIKRWRAEANRADGKRTEPNEPNGSTKTLKAAAQEATDKAIAEAGDYITARLKGLADQLYTLAEDAVGKVGVAIRTDAEEKKADDDLHGEAHDRDGAAWLRGLVGVMAQAIDKAQLLSGKPTVRAEVNDRHEYQITQEIISDNPNLLDRVFAPTDGSRLANRRG